MAFRPQNYRFQGTERRTHAGRLYLQGKSQGDIAEILGISRQRICQYLGEIEREWRAMAVRDWDTAKTEVLAKLDNLERTYWDAWESSLKPREKTMASDELIPVDAPELPDRFKLLRRSKKTVTVEVTDGDARFLDGVYKCIERRCQLLGLDAPKVIDIEMRIREAAEKEGLDGDAAVEEARRYLAEYARK